MISISEKRPHHQLYYFPLRNRLYFQILLYELVLTIAPIWSRLKQLPRREIIAQYML